MSWQMAHSAYLAGLHSSVSSGVGLVISYWSSPNNGMGWLDQPPCPAYTTPSCGQVPALKLCSDWSRDSTTAASCIATASLTARTL